jgi:hypothetical protein
MSLKNLISYVRDTRSCLNGEDASGSKLTNFAIFENFKLSTKVPDFTSLPS